MPAKLPWRKRVAVRSMLEAGIPQKKVGELVGVARSTVQRIEADPELSPDNVQRFKDIAPARFYQKLHQTLDHLTPETFAKMNALQLSIAAKINLQAAREAEGLPSQTVLVKRVAVNLSGELKELQARKERLLASLGGTSVDAQVVKESKRENVRRVVP